MMTVAPKRQFIRPALSVHRHRLSLGATRQECSAARRLAAQGARLTLADIDAGRCKALAEELGADVLSPDRIMDVECDVFSPNALGAIFDEANIARLRTSIVEGGANNQLVRANHGDVLAPRGILYAPDYVINAGGIIAVTIEYLARQSGAVASIVEVDAAVDGIPERLAEVWQESETEDSTPARIAHSMAQKLIGRA